MTISPPPDHNDEDRDLVQQAQQGDVEAFGALYTRHFRLIYRYIYFRVGNEQDAEDLAEDVFVRAWQALPRYRDRQFPLTSWLYRIAHNRVVDYHRKNRLVTLVPYEERDEPALVEKADEMFERRRITGELIAAIQQLSWIEQQVIVLRFVGEVPHQEIGMIIGKSEGASRVIQHRALARLADLLKDRQL